MLWVLISSKGSGMGTWMLLGGNKIVSYKPLFQIWILNPSLAEHDMPCLSKQCRSRSVGF